MQASTLTLALSVLLAPAVALAAPQNFLELSQMIVQFLDNATVTLIVAAIVVYFFGISTNMVKVGKGEANDMRSYLLWGIIIIFVMVSIWGILRLLQNSLFGNANYSGGSTGSAPTCSTFGSCGFGSP